MKKLAILLLLFYFSVLGLSQTSRFGKITNQQWDINQCDFDTTATSIILFDVGKISYHIEDGHDRDLRFQIESISLIFERHLRIKVLMGCGQSLRLLKIPIHKRHEKAESLSTFKGLVIKEKKDKKGVKIKRDALNKISDEIDYYVLELNNIPSGSIIDLEYSTKSNFVTYIPEWSFANNFPSLYSCITYSIPSFFDVTKQSQIFDKLDLKTHGNDATHFVHGGDTPTTPVRKYSYIVDTEIYSLRQIPSNLPDCSSYSLIVQIQHISPNSLLYNDFSFERVK